MAQPASSTREPTNASPGARTAPRSASPSSSSQDRLESHYTPSWQQEIKALIREYQTAATLGAFAVGVFIGVWMRR